MELLAIFLIFTAFLLTRATNLRTAVGIFLLQSAIVAFACIVVGMQTGGMHFYVAALLTVLIKAGVIPYALNQIVKRLRNEKETNLFLNANYASLAAVFAIVITYLHVNQALPGVASRTVLAAAVSLVLIGLQIIIMRRQAVLQIIGLSTMENGLYLVGLSVTQGLPLIIELGIFFDILVAVVVLVILTYRLKISVLSTDTSLLRKLKG